MLADARKRCERARAALPSEGPYAMESLGLKASNFKTNAEVSYEIAMMYATDHPRYTQFLEACHKGLEDAFDDYARAAQGFLQPSEERPQREASLHWVVVQMLSMGSILGHELDEDYWGTGKRSAKACLRLTSTDERAWAYGSLAELAILRLANQTLPRASQRPIAEEAIRCIRELVELYPERGAWQIESTHRQFQRYVIWWGATAFVDYLKSQGVKRRRDWHRHGVLDTVSSITEILAARM
jgi:hypothetical protein